MKLFYEKYIKLAHIGKGANAHVYKVKHAELGYVRAIKILNDYIEDKSDKTYKSFLKECRTLLAIGNGAHPNIVRIYGPDLIDNRAVVEMDFVQGITLDSYIKAKGFLDYEEVKTFIHDIVGALAYTHHDIYKFLMNPEDDDLQPDPDDGQKYVITPEKEAELVKKYGIAHNDLHSNNVMRRDYDGSFVLLDFGLAVQDGECVKSSRKSDGSPEYKAPEKFDSGEITPRSDVYSLGVLIYEVLTGRPPFVLEVGADGKVSYPSLDKICKEHHTLTPPPILPLRKKAFERRIPGAVYERDYPEWLDEVVMKCLAKNPEDRYSDARELLDDINWHLDNDVSSSEHIVIGLKKRIAQLEDERLDALTDKDMIGRELQEAQPANRKLQEQSGVPEGKAKPEQKGRINFLMPFVVIALLCCVAGVYLYMDARLKSLATNYANIVLYAESRGVECDSINWMLDSLGKSSIEYGNFAPRISHDKETVDSLQTVISDLNQQITALQLAHDTIVDYGKECDRLRAENEKLKGQVVRLLKGMN